MTNTFSWTDAHDYPSGDSFRDWPSAGLTLPGHNYNQVVITQNYPSTGTVSVIGRGGNGPWAGADMFTVQLFAGETTKTLNVSGGTVIPSGTTTAYFHQLNNGLTAVTSGLTITVAWRFTDVPDPTPCAYGTEPAVGAAVVTIITGALVDAVCLALGIPWATLIFNPLIGVVLDSGVLCGDGPPPLAPINEYTLLDTFANRLEMFKSAAWYTLCKCTAGSPAPTPFPPPVVTIPPSWPTNPVYACSNTDICTTLQYILKRLDQLSTSQNIQINNNNTIVSTPVPFGFDTDPIFFDVTGSGTIPVQNLVGVKFELLDDGGGPELEGNPPYLWDIGWASASDGGAMLQELRLTRSAQYWFPPAMNLATVIGFFLKGSQTLRIWRLVAVH